MGLEQKIWRSNSRKGEEKVVINVPPVLLQFIWAISGLTMGCHPNNFIDTNYAPSQTLERGSNFVLIFWNYKPSRDVLSRQLYLNRDLRIINRNTRSRSIFFIRQLFIWRSGKATLTFKWLIYTPSKSRYISSVQSCYCLNSSESNHGSKTSNLVFS